MLKRLLQRTLSRASAFALAAVASVSLQSVQAQTAPDNTALPTAPQVVEGSAAVSQNGNVTAPVMTVQQNTDRAIINWNTFNVGRDASVVFQQPASSSVILNRVLDANPSQIFGNLQSNGQVFLLNPAGIFFGPGSSVDVGALVATTHSMSNRDFMAGTYRFDRNGANGKIVNEGSIEAKLGGYIALLAPEVQNSGVLLAKSGTIALAAGETVTMNVNPANSKVDLLVTPSTIESLIENKKIIKAPDGAVIVSAQAYNEIASGVIRNSGEIVATGITKVGGRIVLGASNEVANSGRIDATSVVADGGSVRIDANKVGNSGVIEVSSSAPAGKGGEIIITGRDLALNDGSQLIATGTNGGGKILVGGDWQGSGDLRQAQTVTMTSNASIDASAIQSGDGGTVVLWSDIRNPDSMTDATGTIFAKAGMNGGDGGKIETSGYGLNIAGARVNAGAPKGIGGLWYIDPADTIITQAVANSYAATLNTGTSVLNEVINGSITWNAGVSLSKTSGGDATLTLRISNYTTAQTISLNSANIQSTSGALNLLIWGVSNGYQSLFSVNNSTISTNGGHFWVGGGAASTTLWNGLTVGNGSANSWSADNPPINISGSTITTGAGSVSLAGLNFDSGSTTGTRNIGVLISGGSSLSTTSGSITIDGQVKGRYTNGLGVHLGNTLSSSTTGNVSLSTTTGSISIVGTGTDAANSGSGWRHAVSLFAKNAGEQVNVSSTSGNITIDGRGQFTSAALATNNSAGLLLMSNNATAGVSVVSRSGAITLRGSNTLESSQYLNGFDLIAPNTANAIRIGYDGTNSYSGNILIESNSIVQRNQNAGTGSISAQTSGTLTVQSAGASFTALRAGAAGTLTFDDDWNFGSSLGGFALGKSTNTRDITLTPAISTTGPINLYGGTVTLNAGLTTTDASTGDITIGAINTLVSSSNFSLADGRALSITTGGNSTYAGLISGTNARLIKSGAGTLSLTNANTYSGGTTLNAGRLGIYNSGSGIGSVGSGTLTAANGTSLLFGRAVGTFANNLVFNGNVTIDLDTSVDYLIVGGGGGGGAWVGGGGGGGGALAGTSDLTDSSYAVSVGAGGIGLIYNAQAVQRNATSGGNSSAFGLTAIGGGYGGSWTARVAASGGSGGGQGYSQAAAAGTAGQGFAGGTGNGASTDGYVTGGGGGAGGAGGNWTSTRSGAGGIG
ncbi:MAG: filamentous hemagglutinin N-terminal domain-containing protein, partial [Oxalobacteraceae bacterium]|nr:filamentous hemagglutinin N-terminal domain-containing protein [Oxalobacteraceae bacterium]